MQAQKYTIPVFLCRFISKCMDVTLKHMVNLIHLINLNNKSLDTVTPLLCLSLSMFFALGFAVVCKGIASVWPKVLMLFICAAAGFLFIYLSF